MSYDHFDQGDELYENYIRKGFKDVVLHIRPIRFQDLEKVSRSNLETLDLVPTVGPRTEAGRPRPSSLLALCPDPPWTGRSTAGPVDHAGISHAFCTVHGTISWTDHDRRAWVDLFFDPTVQNLI